MAFETSSVDGYLNLFEALVSFLTTNATLVSAGEDWDIIGNDHWIGAREYWAGTYPDSAYKVFDYDVGTYYRKYGTTEFIAWKYFDPVEILEFKIQASPANGQENEAPKDFTLEYSDDGQSWTPAATVTGETGWSVSEIRSFSVTSPGAHLYWKVNITAVTSGSYVSIGGIYTVDSSGIRKEYPSFSAVLQGPYDTQGNKPLVRLHGVDSEGSDIFNIGMEGAVTYSTEVRDIDGDSITLVSLIEASPPVYSPFINEEGQDNLPYLFVANGRRFVIAVKVNTIYVGFYGGLILPFATPSQWPYPMFVGGCSSNSLVSRSTTSDNDRIFCDPGRYGVRVYLPDNQWWDFHNWYSSSGNRAQDTTRNIAPMDGGTTNKLWYYVVTSIGQTGGEENYDLYPMTLHCSSPYAAVLGELDGVYAVTGFNNAPENVISISGVSYTIFQDMFRSANYNFWALKAE